MLFWLGFNSRSRAGKPEAVGQVSAHSLPQLSLLIFRHQVKLIVVLLELVVAAGNSGFVDSIVSRRAARPAPPPSAAATATLEMSVRYVLVLLVPYSFAAALPHGQLFMGGSLVSGSCQ